MCLTNFLINKPARCQLPAVLPDVLCGERREPQRTIRQNSLACGLTLTVTSKTENSSSTLATALPILVALYCRLEINNDESKRSL
ncbi:MAG: hypothetical protein ACWGP1_07110, partial [Syntrophobacteria bacterium]